MEVVKLGTLTNRRIGYGIVQPGASVSNGVPVIKVNNVVSGLRDVRDLDTTTTEIDSKYSRTKLVGGEIVVSVVGTVGKTAIVPESFAGCNLVRATAMVDILNPLIKHWVKYYIDSPQGQQYIKTNLNTTVQFALNIKSLVEMPIPMYSFEYMNDAVSILKSLDDKIEVNRRINENLEQQAQALFKSWFVDFEPFKDGEFVESELGMIPKGWRVIELADIAEISKVSTNPQKHPQIEFKHYSIPSYDDGMKPEVQLGEEIKSNKFVVENKMILFSKLNPRIKRVWYVDNTEENSVCSTEFVPYRSKDELKSSFLYGVINGQGFYDYVMSMVNGATGSHQRFHPEESLKYKFAYNKEYVEKYSAIITPVVNKLLSNRDESRRLATLRDTLLPRLMSGKLNITI